MRSKTTRGEGLVPRWGRGVAESALLIRRTNPLISSFQRKLESRGVGGEATGRRKNSPDASPFSSSYAAFARPR